jgi:long-chain fatty acid transport protein
LEIELNLQWMGWSAYDKIDVTLPDRVDTLERGYKNTLTYRAGVEYHFPIGLDLRAGYAYDPSPIPADRLTVSLPDIDRHVVSGGLSLHLPDRWFEAGTGLRAMTIDLGVLQVLPGKRQTADQPFQPHLKGEFEVQALVTALSIGASFGGESNPRLRSDQDHMLGLHQ